MATTHIMELLESSNERNEVLNERSTIPVKVVKQKRQQFKSPMDNVDSPINIITELVRKNYSKLTHARNTHEVIASRMNILDNREDLIAFIGQHLKPKDIEKKQNGEVFTPPELIKQKFDKLTEIDPSVWTDPSKKFLDPANGIGNYPALAFHRLMDGLKDAIPDEYQRKKHILENMLYMCELNKKNVEVSKKLFDPKGEFKLNIHCGSFLELDTKDVWGVEKFDVIIGNPPYNGGLWGKFVRISLRLLEKNGYLVFVHPSNWRKPEDKTGEIMNKYNVKFIKIYDIHQTMNIFKCNLRVDWYVLQKIKTSNNITIIVDDKNKVYNINTNNKPFIPNNNLTLIYKLLDIDCPKLNIIRSHKIISNSKKLLESATNTHKFKVLTNLNSKERKIKYTDTPLEDVYDKPKVLMSYSLNLYPFYDTEISPTEHVFYQLVDNEEEGAKLISYLESKLFKLVMKSLKMIGYQTDHKVFKYLPDITKKIDIVNEMNINKLFNFTEEEIITIQNV